MSAPCRLVAIVLLATGSAARAQFVSIDDISPNKATPLLTTQGTGGRVNGLAVDPTTKLVLYAATEWGGIYKSVDGGVHWAHLAGHRPMVTWDVEVNPANPARVYATSFYDGRIPSLSGINVSTDGGATWTRPATAVPPPGTCADPADQTELTAFGIAIDRGNPSTVYIGTSCGLAISTDAGDTWTYSTPAGSQQGVRIWDVVSSVPGVPDVCGDNGHYWIVGSTWFTGSGLPSGLCSIASSPYHPSPPNLFATVGSRFYETTDGIDWVETRSTPLRGGRIPFVETNKRSTAGAFDVWWGDILLYRAGCDAGASGPKCGQRTLDCCGAGGTSQCGNTACRNAVCANDSFCCSGWDGLCAAAAVNETACACDTPAWSGKLVDWGNGYGDQGTILFDPAVQNDACPILNSADAGVVYNNLTTSPACQTPVWKNPQASPHALWPWGLDGADLPSQDDDHVYLGTQDNGMFGAFDAALPTPFWVEDVCCDVFDVVAEAVPGAGYGTVVYSQFSPLSLWRGRDNFASRTSFGGPVQGFPPLFRYPDAIVRWGEGKYAMVTDDCWPGSSAPCGDGGLFVTNDLTTTPVVWVELGNNSEPEANASYLMCNNWPPRSCTTHAQCGAGALCDWNATSVYDPTRVPCAVYSGIDPGTAVPTFFVQTGSCDGRSATDRLFRFVGSDPNGDSWVELSLGGRGFGIVAVDPKNPLRLMASSVSAVDAFMVRSENGGTTWMAMPELNPLMDGAGDFKLKPTRGPTDFTGMYGYPQPSLAAFDPFDASNLLVGAQDSGIFYSTDDGDSWSLVTDPRNPHLPLAKPHIPRPRDAYFSEADHDKSIYLASQGRGVWRLRVCDGDPYEPDDDSPFAKPIASGETQNRSICGTGNDDWALVSLTRPSAIVIQSATAVGDTTLRLVDGNLQSIDFANCCSGGEGVTRIERTCAPGSVLPPGPYFVVADDFQSNDTITDYALSLSVTPCCGNGALDVNEACDDGNTVDGDCCSSACAFEPTFTACDDGDACTQPDTCSGFGICVGGPTPPPSFVLGAALTSTLLTWEAEPDATAYDVVFGDLIALRSGGGDFTAATSGCVVAETPLLEADHTGLVPAPGGGFWFLVRGDRCATPGSFDELSPKLVEPRNEEILAKGLPCLTP